MRKKRYEESFLGQDLSEFGWIRSVRRIENFLPTATETYEVAFSNSLQNMEKTKANIERSRFRKFVKEFLGVNKSVLPCWRETGVILIIFPAFN